MKSALSTTLIVSKEISLQNNINAQKRSTIMSKTKNMTLSCIILAAGKGTRMHSAQAKVLHPIANMPMIQHIVKNAQALNPLDICVVIGPDMQAVESAVTPHSTALQETQNGTGGAVIAAKKTIEANAKKNGHTLIMLGDAPLITPETLTNLVQSAQKTGLSVLGMDALDPKGYGRLIQTKDETISAIIEDKDCKEDQRDITLCNAGLFCAKSDLLLKWLDRLDPNNAQNELYLTDIVKIAATQNVECALSLVDEHEAMGINDKTQLAQAEWLMQERLREAAMLQGVTLQDPQTTYLSADTVLASDVTIEPNVWIGSNVTVENNVTIHAFSHLSDTILKTGTTIGPFARLRGNVIMDEGSVAGNFVEVKNSHFGKGSKAKHLAYIGDTVIGEKTNISAGVITVNYDGFEKHQTTIGSNVMVGCDTTLVAPVTIGDGAYIAAGSAITKNVAPDSLAVARNRPIIREGWAKNYRNKKQKDKK
jgi:bifunctional UDP-N-acetylglucosamine pyrophosphorylase/glucosamine-1-phosphate N-acetyltransferase